jgi:hypothetical protein
MAPPTAVRLGFHFNCPPRMPRPKSRPNNLNQLRHRQRGCHCPYPGQPRRKPFPSRRHHHNRRDNR